MVTMNTGIVQSLKTWQRGICLLLVIAMTALNGGCATGTKAKLKSLGKGNSVARLKDGRKGFIIKETPRMSGESRRDFQQAVKMLQEEKFDQAIELLQKVIAQSPGVTAPYINIAMAYIQLEKLDSAEEHLKKALGLFPYHPVASNEYGLLLRKKGRFEEARGVFAQTLVIFPEYYPAHRNLGILCDLYLNDHACALKEYEIYSAALPEDEQVKLWIADLRMRMGR